jgi:hypothetical protein
VLNIKGIVACMIIKIQMGLVDCLHLFLRSSKRGWSMYVVDDTMMDCVVCVLIFQWHYNKLKEIGFC